MTVIWSLPWDFITFLKFLRKTKTKTQKHRNKDHHSGDLREQDRALFRAITNTVQPPKAPGPESQPPIWWMRWCQVWASYALGAVHCSLWGQCWDGPWENVSREDATGPTSRLQPRQAQLLAPDCTEDEKWGINLPGGASGKEPSCQLRRNPWGCWGLDTTERLPFHFSLSCIGEGNGNPLQCSCLENPRDGRAWWAAVYGVAQGRTQLKRLSNSSRVPLLSQKIPWRRKWQPISVLLPGNSHGRKSLEGYSPRGRKELDMTEPQWRVHVFLLLHNLGRRKSKGLQGHWLWSVTW